MPCARSDHQRPTWRELTGLYRVSGWIQFLGLVLLGHYWVPGGTAGDLLAGLLIAAGCLAYAYGINNYYDRQVDARSPTNKNPLAREGTDTGGFRAAVAAPALLALVIAAMTNSSSVVITLAAIVVATVYSAPPWRLKHVPVVGFAWNGLLFAPLFVLGWTNASGRLLPGLALSLFFALPVLIVEVFHELQDLPDDERGGCPTLPVLFGPTRARAVAIALAILLVAIAVWLLSRGVLAAVETVICVIYAAFAGLVAVRQGSVARWTPRATRLILRGATAAFGLLFLAARLWG